MSENPSSRGNDFKLERYKYILQQLNMLNDYTHKYLTLFQTLVTAVIGGGIVIFISWKELKIDAEIARVALRGIMVLLVVLALFVIASIIAGIFSWFDYRREETKLLNEAVSANFREQPKIGNIWRWYEFYAVLFFVTVTLILLLFLEFWIMPLIK